VSLRGVLARGWSLGEAPLFVEAAVLGVPGVDACVPAVERDDVDPLEGTGFEVCDCA